MTTIVPSNQLIQGELLEAALDQAVHSPTLALELLEQAWSQSKANDGVRLEVLFHIAQTLYQKNLLGEALEVLRSALNWARGNQAARGRLEVLKLLGRICREKGELDQAAQYLGQAFTLARGLDDPELQADLLNQQAGVLHSRAEHTRALQALAEAIDLSRKVGNRAKEASYLNNIGVLQTYLGDFPVALQNLIKAYELLREGEDNARDKAINLISIGNLYDQMQEPQSALDYYRQALGRTRQAGLHLIETIALINMTQSLLKTKALEEAEQHGQSALELARKRGSEKELVHALDVLAQVYEAKGDHEGAHQTYCETLEIAQNLNLKVAEIDGLLGLGRSSLSLREPQMAIGYLQRALTAASESQQAKSVFLAHQFLADAYESEGDLVRCVFHLRQYHAKERLLFNEESEHKQQALSSMLELERARNEAESYRMRTEVEHKARLEAEQQVAERTHELEQARLEVLSRLALAAEYRDDKTGEHTWRVGRNAALIAKQMGWSEGDVELIRLAARLHDVGKIGIPDSILLKPDRLTPEEFQLMKAHTAIGGRILSGGHSRLLRMAEEIAVSHHERWDGKGYPKGIAGEAIPLTGRIVAVADVLDALTHERPYKRAWSVKEALEEISKQSGQHFDPRIVEACLQVFRPDNNDVEGHMQALDSRLSQSVRLERLQLGIEQQELELVQR